MYKKNNVFVIYIYICACDDCNFQNNLLFLFIYREIRVSSFMSDLERGKKAAQVLMQKVPHIIPHKEV